MVSCDVAPSASYNSVDGWECGGSGKPAALETPCFRILSCILKLVGLVLFCLSPFLFLVAWMCLPRDMLNSLSQLPVKVTLSGNGIFAGAIKMSVRWSHPGGRWALILSDWGPVRRAEEAHRVECRVKTQACTECRRSRDTGRAPWSAGGRHWRDVSTAKECQAWPATPEAGRDRRDCPLQVSVGARPCWHRDLGPLASGTGRENISNV